MAPATVLSSPSVPRVVCLGCQRGSIPGQLEGHNLRSKTSTWPCAAIFLACLSASLNLQLIQQHVGPQKRVGVGGTCIPLHALIHRMPLKLWYMEKCWSNKIGVTNKRGGVA